MTYYPSFEWLKMKKGIFLGLEIPRDCLHFAMKFSLPGGIQLVPEEVRM